MPSARARYLVACTAATRVEEARPTRHARPCAACGCRACKQARAHAAMVVQLVTSPQELSVGHHGYFTSTTTACACSICYPPLPVPVLAPHTSTPNARARMIAPGRAHRRPRARDRAAPSERDGTTDHVNCASVTLHKTLVRRRPAARTQLRAARQRGRRTVALVSEIATPSNTSSPLPTVIAPPFACTRADAERFHCGLTLMGAIMDVTLYPNRHGSH
jgi:hypothetical protein